jgi:hypothetical protein
MIKLRTQHKVALLGIFSISAAFAFYFFSTPPIVYDSSALVSSSISDSSLQNSNADISSADENSINTNNDITEVPTRRPKATHVKTPDAVKTIYMTSWVASTRDWRASLVKLIEETELNSIIIDIKDYTGRISFKVHDPLLVEIGSEEIRINDIEDFINLLHQKGIYVIGRITVFQDPYLATLHPEIFVKTETDKNKLWEDGNGIHYIDPGAKFAWDYIVALAKESYAVGFDELNFDYIRFPSDGNMRDIYFPVSEERVNTDIEYGKAKVVRDFFAYLHKELTHIREEGVITSADLFGMVTTNYDDLNVGQVMEYALPYFDYIAPMTYPSHYPRGFNGWQNPNKHVYGVIKYSMDRAVNRLAEQSTTISDLGDAPIPRVSTSSPQLYSKKVYSKEKLRPWLQDFDYGGDYDVEEVRAQIQAVYDAGLDSWMLWDPANKYTRGALLPAE